MRRFFDWTANQAGNPQLSSLDGLGHEEDLNLQHSSSHQELTRKQDHLHQHQSTLSETPDLEVQHLIKLLHEIKYYQASSSPLPNAASHHQREFVQKIHRTLPLFLKVFANRNVQQQQQKAATSRRDDLPSLTSDTDNVGCDLTPTNKVSPHQVTISIETHMYKLPDLLPFAFTIARLFVSEVRQLASNKQAEEASLAILKFLQSNDKNILSIDISEQSLQVNNRTSQGWNLLLSLNTLALSHNSQIINLLCDASLPSTLIKCLYLFYDLPETKIDHKDSNSAPCDVVNLNQLIKAFTQLLVNLCSNQSAIDELIKKDDLRLLIGIASGQCPKNNKPWRNTTFQVLLTISKNMSSNFQYLEKNVCIQVYVENMYRIKSLSLVTIDELVDMIHVLIEVLYNLEISNRSQMNLISPLVEQFKSSRTTDFIEEIVSEINEAIEQSTIILGPILNSIDSNVDSPSPLGTPTPFTTGSQLEDFRQCAKKIMQSLTILAKINVNPDSMSNITSLKPLAINRFEMLDQFKLIEPSKSHCILNLEAIRLLKSFWSRCQDIHVTEAILDATISLFNDDRFNYYIFESQQLLVYYLSSDNFDQHPYKIKQKFFKFLEFIIIETNYIPCIELGSLGNYITKTNNDSNVILGLKTLIACLKYNTKFSNVFRELGILKVITLLIIKTVQTDTLCQEPDKIQILHLLLEASQRLVSGPNNINCVHFNESGAARHVFNCLSEPKYFYILNTNSLGSSSDEGSVSRTNTPSPCSRSLKPQPLHMTTKPSIKQIQKISLTIMRQLILSSVCDEHIANLLSLITRSVNEMKEMYNQGTDSATNLVTLLSHEINLKISILKSLIIVLKESHRCRTLFRRAGGFSYIISTLNILENSLPSPANTEIAPGYEHWLHINSRKIWRLIKSSLLTIVVAMRYEPANLRSFCKDFIDEFNKSIISLGCFNKANFKLNTNTTCVIGTDSLSTYKDIFLSPPTKDFSTVAHEKMVTNEACCQLFRFLYDMALDMADGTIELQAILSANISMSKTIKDVKSISLDQESRGIDYNVAQGRMNARIAPKRPPSLEISERVSKPAVITYPCVIISIFDILPSCPSDDLIEFTIEVLKSIFKSERNQQLLCDAGLINKLLSDNWNIAITNSRHYLHNSCTLILERLSSHYIRPKELRSFWRLENPLRSQNLDDIDPNEKRPLAPTEDKIPIKRIETFVSMLSNEKSPILPAFIEFDMNFNTYSYIFMPSIAPVNSKSLQQSQNNFLKNTLDLHLGEKNGLLGGVGAIERIFPPSGGFTFSTWICIEKFPSRSSDPLHSIRILTIYRGSASTGKEYSCFRVSISAYDRSIIISTQETLLFENEPRLNQRPDPECNLRVWAPEMFVEGQWHHLALAMTRSPLKQSDIHVYVDGVQIYSQKINYMSNYVGASNSVRVASSNVASSSSAAFVNAFIGAFPQYNSQLQTRWKQGPFHLIEDTVSQELIHAIYVLGPNYIGNFQCAKLIELSKFPIYDFQDCHVPHRPLLNQQSAANVSSSVQHEGSPFKRVASSSYASESRSRDHHHPGSGHSSKLSVSEERIMVSVDARASSLMTLSRMRRIYTRFDCRQVSRVLGLAINENSTPLILLHNSGVHLNGPSRTIGAVALGMNSIRCFIPNPTRVAISDVGGAYLLLGLIAQAKTVESLHLSVKAFALACHRNSRLQTQMDNINGYQILSLMFCKKQHLIDEKILRLILFMITDPPKSQSISNVQHSIKEVRLVIALRDLICELFELWLQTDLMHIVLEFIYNVTFFEPAQYQAIKHSVNRQNAIKARNLKALREMDLLPRLLALLPKHSLNQNCDSTDISDIVIQEEKTLTLDDKTIFTIKQILYELLNKTSRQSDILHFGQFMASLLPADNQDRPKQTINLRNILLKSLLQLMTTNHQPEVNQAMQEKLVRILGFDWFMLFINGSYLDKETIIIGFLNLMIVLTHDDLYQSFKTKPTSNGAWLKQPTFPTIDARSNIQLLGMNVGIFFGMNPKVNPINQSVLGAPNLFLLTCCLSNLIKFPQIYFMLFLTMMNNFAVVNQTTVEAIANFDKLNLDVLCDNLVGDTHHKRRQILANVNFKCKEFIICIVYMIRDVICYCELMTTIEKSSENSELIADRVDISNYPSDLAKFIMYLYNNHKDFQTFCRNSDDLIEAVSEALMKPDYTSNFPLPSQPTIEESPCIKRDGFDSSHRLLAPRQMAQHRAIKEVLEFGRLLIIESMTDCENLNVDPNKQTSKQLHAFEKFLECLSTCHSAQGELVDMLLRQILLMIDSTARNNNIKTIAITGNVAQFQLLLVNSVLVCDIVTDKIWSNQLYENDLSRINTIIDHFLNITEQVFKFNELLPRQNPSPAMIMQRTVDRLVLFALSRNTNRVPNTIALLELLKKIHDQQTLIILNHVQSTHSSEFFVCLTYCILRIIENYAPSSDIDSSAQLSNQPPMSPLAPVSPMLLVTVAKHLWNVIYQSKRDVLSEAFEVPMTLAAFTLETSIDLLELKPSIIDVCKQTWKQVIEVERNPSLRKKKMVESQLSTASSATQAAANLLAGKLTRVVNAASFVSRVVGATAGSVAQNVASAATSTEKSARRENFHKSSTDYSSSGSVSSSYGSVESPGNVRDSSNVDPTFCNFKCFGLNKSKVEKVAQTHVSVVDEYMKSQMSSKNHKLALRRYLFNEWIEVEFENLLRERAIFGPNNASDELDRWTLDLTEGPRRMRKKMVNNTRHFYRKYQYCAEQFNPSNKSLKYRPPMSYDSQAYYLKTRYLPASILDDSGDEIYDDTTNEEATNTDTDEAKESIAQACINGREDVLDSPQDRVSSIPLSSLSIRIDPATPTASPESLSPSATTVGSRNKGSSNKNDSNSDFDFESATGGGGQTCETSSSPDSSSRPQTATSDCGGDDGDSTSFVDFGHELDAAASDLARDAESNDSLTVLRLLEKNEQISHMFRCSRVQGLDTYEGLLLFGKEHFYLIDGFTLLKTREIKDIDSFPRDVHDPIVPSSTPNISTAVSTRKKACAKFSLDSVIEVHKRRYLLQPIALEVFSSDGRNTLIVFPPNIRNKVYSRFMAVATQLTLNASESLAGQKSSVSIDASSGLLSSLIGETSVTQRWVRGEISNFQYLMCLNTIAGRSYNDLMQYPIFPWILADYTSETLNLTKRSTFRDLSRPIGAQTADRLEQFKRRFAEWDDSETPPYHYGTFYSSAMIVASYMVRMEPFTQHFLRLQGGHFDLADRMFHSVNDSWLSASKHNMADIKELIPEFFYLPEFLVNANKFDLGIKQNSEKLSDVKLPPWANNDPREFIRLNRCALESDYVSAHLHEWIDLIFGYKQQGQPAVDSVNVFHHLFYEGNVDIYNTDIDPVKKNAVIGFINNFGQVPKQLFKKPHPARRQSTTPAASPLPIAGSGTSSAHSLLSSNATGRWITQAPHLLRQTQANFRDLNGPVGQIVQLDSRNVLAVEQNKMLIPPELSRIVAWGYPDRSLRLTLLESEKAIFVWETADYATSPNEVLCCAIPNSRTMITAGTDSTLTVWRIERARNLMPIQSLYGHCEPVTCLAASQSYALLVSGARDKSCIVWDLNKFTFVRQLGLHKAPISALSINDLTGDIASCAGAWLYVWSINGELVASVDTSLVTTGVSTPLHLLSVCFSECTEWSADEFVATGASNGAVCLWSVRHWGELVRSQDEEQQSLMKKIVNKDKPAANDSPRSKSVLEVDSLQAPPETLVASSKSDTCLADSFVLLESCTSAKDPQGASSSLTAVTGGSVPKAAAPRVWHRELYLRAQLLRRAPSSSGPGLGGGAGGGAASAADASKAPPAVTALSISKDHKALFVGDATGRVSCFSTNA